MTPEGRAELKKIRDVRGYTLPLHEMLADLNPEFLRRYGELSSFVIFGITTAAKGDREGIEWSAARAMQNGATWDEVREAAFLAALPCGMPAFEAACRVFRDLEKGKSLTPLKRAKRKKARGAGPRAR
jgi:4-carboxymuconolactone decarboxylase